MSPTKFRTSVNQLLHDWAQTFEAPALGIAAGTVPVYYENGPDPDPTKLKLWVELETRFYSSSLIAVGRSDGRHTGALSIGCYIKSGEGTQVPDAILQSLSSLLRRRRFGANAYTQFPEWTIPPSPSFYGWRRSGLLVPFILHEIATI